MGARISRVKDSVNPVRLLSRAGFLALIIFAGYALGMALVLLRISLLMPYQQVFYSEPPPAPKLLKVLLLGHFRNDFLARQPASQRYPHAIISDIFGEYPKWDTLIRLSGKTFLIVLCVTTFSLLLVRLAPSFFPRIALAPALKRDTPGQSWSEILGERPMRWKLTLFAGAVLGFSSATLGESVAILVDLFWGDSQWWRGRDGPFLYMRPFFALLAWPDALWLLLGTFLLTAGSALTSARARLSQDPAIVAQWCLHCGYPRPSLISDKGAACSECGKPPGLPASKFRVKHFKLLIAAVLVLSIVAYFAVRRIMLP